MNRSRQSVVMGRDTGMTLGDLRRLLADAEHLPDEAEVRVRTRMGANADGSKLRRVHLIDPGEST